MLILIVLLNFMFLGTLLWLGKVTKSPRRKFTNNRYLNQQIYYQPLALVIALISLLATYVINPDNFRVYFRFGNLSATGQPISLLGISAHDKWGSIALSMTIIISLATLIYMATAIRKTRTRITAKTLLIILGPVIVFALLNSFTEEAITRLGIVSPLTGMYSMLTIIISSAVVFGLPHYFGVPKGVIGMILAGFLGLILAKSVYETQGIFLAWSIHFVQDVIIIGALALISAQTKTPATK